VNPAYEFDNLSEKQVHVGSGKYKNRSGDGSTVAAPRPTTQPPGGVRGTDRFRRCIGFSCFPPRGRTRSG